VKTFSSTFVLFLLMALPALANFQAGVTAYDQGNYATAVQEWQPSADRGDPNAEFNLGLMYQLGRGVPQDDKQAAEWYRKAAGQGVAAAQFNLGVLYANGQGVEANPQEAIQWFLQAAAQGIHAAEMNLGDLYSDSKSPAKNYGEAATWYRKAAERGVLSAEFDLGVLYDLGEGMPQSYMDAIYWYTKAADAGYAPAMVNLGILYYNQQGVKRDLVQAYAWFARAEKLNEPRAGELFRTAAERMKPKEIKRAELVAQQWNPSLTPQKPASDEAVYFKQPETAIATTSATPVSQPAASDSADRGASTEPAPSGPPAPQP
jgi:uncharacterized protein